MTDIAILGAGGFGREVNLIIQQLIKKHNSYNFLGYFDDEDKSEEFGKNYLGNIQTLNKWDSHISIAVAVGNGQTRKKMVDRISNSNVRYASLISPYAILNDVMTIGKGSIICAGANLTTNIRIDNFVVVNLNATIGHDCQLNDFVSVMPGANLAGNVVLEEMSFVGSGASILNGLRMDKSSVLGAGAVLTKNLEARQVAIGVPAKPVKK
ncbi:acetyltransferase [Marivirga sp. S37H4]|uniref:Acetyltransferase n=1 Tax=Marivirga aurantiaca TaxID=2802615 RepID=A0A935C6H1_9BACT|nr:acetyltransferase [Marivirga aurantiaca]MBK6264446.1 acetyltransferase [Marivirga aurantiaca]